MTMGRLRRVFAAVSLQLLLMLVAAGPAAAQGSRPVNWQRVDVDLDIQPTGSLIVSETQASQLNDTFQGGGRVVPLDRTTGASDVLVAELVGDRTMANGHGGGAQANTYSSSVGPEDLRIEWSFPATTNATRTLVWRYILNAAIRIHDAGDQLQWRAIYATERDGRSPTMINRRRARRRSAKSSLIRSKDSSWSRRRQNRSNASWPS
jgi:hypothetical protein